LYNVRSDIIDLLQCRLLINGLYLYDQPTLLWLLWWE